MSRRIRVLQIIQNLIYGGMERLLADIVLRADPSRFEPHVMALQYLGRFADGLSKVATVHLAEPMGRASLLWPRKLTEHIGRIAPDVVHTHTGVWYKATLAARRAGVPFLIHTEHGREHPDPWFARVQDGLASRQTDVVVAVSEVLARQLKKSVVRDRAPIRVVMNGVDTELHRPRADSGCIRAALDIPFGAPVIGSIGRLEYIKGYDVMVEGFARLLALWPAGKPAPLLLVVGEGGQRTTLEARVATLGVERSVRFLGWRDDVQELHATFSLFTMSSRSEGTSVSLLEAMSAGLCPVVTDVGGNAAVLGPGLLHRLVRPGDPGALATAWLDALGSHARRQDDAMQARGRVVEEFSLPRMVHAYEAIYEERFVAKTSSSASNRIVA